MKNKKGLSFVADAFDATGNAHVALAYRDYATALSEAKCASRHAKNAIEGNPDFGAFHEAISFIESSDPAIVRLVVAVADAMVNTAKSIIDDGGAHE